MCVCCIFGFISITFRMFREPIPMDMNIKMEKLCTNVLVAIAVKAHINEMKSNENN